MTPAAFEARIMPEAALQADRSLRYVNSPLEQDLAIQAAWPFICRALIGRFPWEPPRD